MMPTGSLEVYYDYIPYKKHSNSWICPPSRYSTAKNTVHAWYLPTKCGFNYPEGQILPDMRHKAKYQNIFYWFWYMRASKHTFPSKVSFHYITQKYKWQMHKHTKKKLLTSRLGLRSRMKIICSCCKILLFHEWWGIII